MNPQISMNRDVRAVESVGIDPMRLQILLQQGGIAIVTNLIVSSLTAMVLYPKVNQGLLLGWWTISIVVNSCRLWHWYKLRNKNPEKLDADSIRRCETQYAAALFVSGVIWGTLGGFFSTDLPLTQQITIPLVICGMSAGAFFSYLSSLRSFHAFVLPMLLAVSFSIFSAGLYTVALITLVYLVAIMLLARNLNRKMLESLRLRQENRALVSHLSDINQAQSDLVNELRAKETFLLHTFEDAGVPMLLMDNSFLIMDVNKAGCELFGYDKKTLKGRNAKELLHPDDSSEITPQFKKLLAGEIKQYRITRRCISRQGRTLWLNSTISAVRNDNNEIEYVVIQAQDITEQYLLSEDLQHQALHDALTGLPNRRALEKQLQATLSQQSDTEHVLCYLDLDQFKVINDTCGHIAGDALLKQMSQLLREGLGEQDMLARFSGDEFAVLMTDCSLQRAQSVLESLLETIRTFSFEYENYTFKITACIGLVAINKNSSLVELLKQADSACYAAKEAGRDRLHLFSDTDTDMVQRTGEMRWVARIQQALSDNRLVLYSQPIQAALRRNEGLPHCELLIRMLDDDGKIISPGQFLPAAERYNLAAAIDMWTVEHVLSRLSAAKSAGRDISGIYAINLSGQSLGDGRFYERIIQLIVDARLSEDNAVLCFEVTETAAITNMRSALHFINELRQIGCQFALDDFGSGLSSFAYLKQLPIDYLKIDGMFVRDCVHNTVNLEIVNSINGIGQVLGLKTVAEFVEDETTLISLQHIGVDFVQGYLIAAPVPWEV
ncbi:MAG: EAL domain-containing protein [Methylophaga sp.]|nr:EAL domain-containing protein [Methylophaga sp.]